MPRCCAPNRDPGAVVAAGPHITLMSNKKLVEKRYLGHREAFHPSVPASSRGCSVLWVSAASPKGVG